MFSRFKSPGPTLRPRLNVGLTLIALCTVWQSAIAETADGITADTPGFLTAAPAVEASRFRLGKENAIGASHTKNTQAGQRASVMNPADLAACREALGKHGVAQSNPATLSYSTTSQWTALAAVVLFSAISSNESPFPHNRDGTRHHIFDNPKYAIPIVGRNPQPPLTACRDYADRLQQLLPLPTAPPQ